MRLKSFLLLLLLLPTLYSCSDGGCACEPVPPEQQAETDQLAGRGLALPNGVVPGQNDLRFSDFDAFRLLCHGTMRGFDQRIYTLWKTDTGAVLRMELLRGLSMEEIPYYSYTDPGAQIVDYVLSPEQWDHFTSTVDEHCFWTMPSLPQIDYDRAGSVWLIEGYRVDPHPCTDRNYHLVIEHLDYETSDLRVIIDEFLDLRSFGTPFYTRPNLDSIRAMLDSISPIH